MGDCKYNKDLPKVKTIELDLTLADDQRVFWEIILDPEVEFVHFGVPCGTASRAREVRLKNTSGKANFVDPKPLRSYIFPDGLAGLSEDNEKRVHSANALYELTAKAILVLSQRGVAWSVENPQNSLLWKTSWFAQTEKVLGESKQEVVFQMCMHGGARPKKTKLWFGNITSLSTLGLVCDGKHQHMPWGLSKAGPEKFATAEERRYPNLFCRRLANAVRKEFGYEKAQKPLESHTEKVSAGQQPRKGLSELISEFKKLEIVAESDLVLGEGDKVVNKWSEKDGEGNGLTKCKIGRAWSPDQFIEQAEKLVHRFDRSALLPPAVAKAMNRLAELGPDRVVAWREEVLARYTVRAEQLAQEAEQCLGLPHDTILCIRTRYRPKSKIQIHVLMVKDSAQQKGTEYRYMMRHRELQGPPVIELEGRKFRLTEFSRAETAHAPLNSPSSSQLGASSSMVRRRRTSSRVVSGHSKLAYAAAARAERSHGRPYPPLARGAPPSAAVADSAEGVAAPAAPPLKRRARGPGESVHRGRRARAQQGASR